MNPKACPDCGRIFRDETKWILHHSDQMCRAKKQRLAEVQAREIVEQHAAGKTNRWGWKRRF